ncbi:CAMK family protein kinase [Trichomonas vaginalis G3]|uniref:CAMK family protein kinase n=1 Tax=Trichomonas vaginalis (strain ATCC PRA-98 / G3) TaxID=412133 RepID=A2ERR6_TRIV3|nr:protein serine/threonine kinase protein [Trichomonas vaginalis G3]EAY04647.1 CAMK family protein kinase [Trichomonas vaginalis G3]KAI5549422.1 protein serine/threonine kinase protein [Trichomonas vaginalis G3]|eukprot:XP_001316870.1 CAMK family protein kinase [Trichomonas vaginalis G3]
MMNATTLGNTNQINIPPAIGCYVPIHVIGEGASSVVVVVRHSKTKDLFACKIISRKNQENYTFIYRLETEIRVLERIRHPGIVKIQDILYIDDLICIIMEYGRRGMLYDYVINRGHLPEWEATKILVSLLNTLEYLHSINVAHRDLKLDNIVLTQDFQPKLVDFGLSYQALSDDDNYRRTFCGTLEYVAPESFEHKNYDGRKADIWSLGICYYSMLTCQYPWKGTDRGIMKAILAGEVEIPEQLSDRTKEVLKLLLTPDPEKRPTAREMLELMYQMGVPDVKLDTLKTQYNTTVTKHAVIKQNVFVKGIFARNKKASSAKY